MKQYKVFANQSEITFAIVEANSPEEAMHLADLNYSDYDWDYCDGTLETDVIANMTEVYSD